MKKVLIQVFLFCLSVTLVSCGGNGGNGTEGDLNSKRKMIQQYNLEAEKKISGQRSPYDTLAVKEYVVQHYPDGSYLVEVDRSLTMSDQKPAVLYYNNTNGKFIFAIVARSKPGDKTIETKRITGYESSFINLDSTKLGTALFYLTLFECVDEGLKVLWEHEIPMHGGFNKLFMNLWKAKNIPYVTVNFEDGVIIGHRNYNFFLVNGIRSLPHMLETYDGVSTRRTMANINNDSIPDYYEYIYYDVKKGIYPVDSVPFTWKKNLYVNNLNPRQTRPW